MKTDLRWQLLLAVLGFGLVYALLSYQVQSGRLCSVTVPAAGGDFSEGMIGRPQYLNPLLADSNPLDREISSLLFDGLTRYEDGELVESLAERWSVSDDGLNVRFVLRNDVQWHDGQPLTAEDVAFTYGLMQSPDFPGDPALKRLWQSVTIEVVDDQTIEFRLAEPYAGFLQATTRGILPRHLLEDVSAAELAQSSFNQEPVGTGPFVVEPGQEWVSDRALRLQPAPAWWPQGTQLEGLVFRFYGNEQELLAAFESGEIQSINHVSSWQLPDVASLAESRIFSAPAERYTSLLFNLSASESPATQDKSVREALIYALDQERLVDQALHGQGLPLNGPYLPTSWAYEPELLAPHATNHVSATLGLEEAGWLTAEGESMRRKDGNLLTLRLLVNDSPGNRALAEEIIAQWSAVGAAPQMLIYSEGRPFKQALTDGDFDVALIEVRPPPDPDLYDFWSQEALFSGQNFAGWNRRRASEALEAGRKVWDPEERKPYYDTFLRLYNEDLPEQTLFQHVNNYAISEAVNEVSIGRIDHPRDRYRSFAAWFMHYRDVTVACEADAV